MMNRKNEVLDFNESIYPIVRQMKDHAKNGKLWVEIFNRDCDLVESTEKEEVAATLDALFALEEQVYREAEGVCWVRILTQAEAERFEEHHRDRGLEHFEEYGYGH
jgi:hypothetical protein